MADQPRGVPKGRAALILSLLQKAQQQRPGEAPPESTSTPEPPKPRGRAALLQKLQAQAQSRVGAESGPSTTAKTDPVAQVAEKLEKAKLEDVPQEPCYYRGEHGKRVRITANYVRLKVNKNFGVFNYDLKFDPPIDSKQFRVKILNTQMPKMGKIKMYDGGAQLYLPIKLPDKVTTFDCKHPNTDEDVTMTVTFIKQQLPKDCLHLYNILFKRVMHALLYSPFGRNYFSPERTAIIPQHKLEILPGYAIAVDEYEDGIMLCLDTQHRVLRTQSVLELLREYHSACGPRFKEMANKHIVGSSILTRYNNKIYVVDEIMWGASPNDTFNTFDGKEIAYKEYYKKQHNLEIKDDQQPLLLNKKSVRQQGTLEKVDKFICLVPELCYLTGLTDEMRSDFKVMKDVAQHTRVTPNQRMHALRKYLENVAKNEDAQRILREWGLELDKATIDLHAQVINPELILFGEGVSYQCNTTADWNGAVSKNKMLGPIDLMRWIVIYTERDTRNAKAFGETMQRLAAGMGCRIGSPKLFQLNDDRTDSYVNACNKLITQDVQAMVFICPTIRSDRYSAIKKMTCVQKPVASQVIMSRTLANQQKVRTITQKIALQINCKLGGSLWSVKFPFRNWMIIGIDVYHSPGSKQSVCAFVASMNESITSWYSQCIFQEREIGDHLKLFFAKALEEYRNKNGEFPKKVIVYRDGVGDGQLQHCTKYEVPQFENCLRQFKIDDCTVCYIIVQKRINTRMFLQTGPNELENPAPGTVLDNTVTRRLYRDFFLVSQHVRQGTVTPTHYVVLHDTTNVKPEHVQKLSYKLCHLYYNWAGTVRVPAPCQYAHKLAYLVGQAVGKVPADVLNDRLFYL